MCCCCCCCCCWWWWWWWRVSVHCLACYSVALTDCIFIVMLHANRLHLRCMRRCGHYCICSLTLQTTVFYIFLQIAIWHHLHFDSSKITERWCNFRCENSRNAVQRSLAHWFFAFLQWVLFTTEIVLNLSICSLCINPSLLWCLCPQYYQWYSIMPAPDHQSVRAIDHFCILHLPSGSECNSTQGNAIQGPTYILWLKAFHTTRTTWQ